MKIATLNNVIVFIGDDIYVDINHYNQLSIIINNEIMYSNNEDFGIYEVDISNDIIAQKYCYTPELGFYLNDNYVEPSIDEPEEPEPTPDPIDEIELLKQKNLELEAQLSNLNESFISFMDLFIQMNPGLAT